jgi:hypothetical protein
MYLVGEVNAPNVLRIAAQSDDTAGLDQSPPLLADFINSMYYLPYLGVALRFVWGHVAYRDHES